MSATKANLSVEPNGEMTITNDRTTITLRADGTVVIATYDPIQLAGVSLAKLDDSNIGLNEGAKICSMLAKRLPKKG